MEERTMTFSINGDFITRLAREKCHYEGKMEYAMNLLESCLESDEITDNERKGLAFAILDGRAEVTGTYPGDDYRFHYLDQRDEQWNIARTLEKLHEKAEQAEKELHQVEEKLGFVASGYMSSWDRREAQKQYMEETGEKLFVNMEEERESAGSTLLDSFIKRMKSETDDDYGWLEPNGTFHPVEFGEHESWAKDHVAEFYRDEHEEKRKEARKYILYGDFLTDRGWVLLHNPSQGIAIPTTSPGKRYTKAQKECLYQYFIDRNCEKEANEIWED